jgi:MtfA peptidase
MFKSLLARLGAASRVAIPDDLWLASVMNLPFVATLDEVDQGRLRTLSERLLAEKEMSAAGGLELDSPMQVLIAVQACLPILNLGIDWYRGWSSIVVYPSEFLVPREITDESGVVHEYTEPISGEAWDGGPLIVSWEDIQDGTPRETAWSYNVVIHEFTHKLDMLNGAPDGVPPFDRDLHPKIDPNQWRAALNDAFERLNAEIDLIVEEMPADIDPDSAEADIHYAHLPLDPYAGQDEGEFFAVSSEQFFVNPVRLQQAFPDWYAQLALFFRQDPLARTRG